MDIGIEVSSLYNSHSGRGIGIYTKLLIEALQKYKSKHTYHFFTRGQKVPKKVDVIHYPYFDPFFLTLPVRRIRPTVVTVHDLIPLEFPDKFPPGLKGSLRWYIQRYSLQSCEAVVTDSETSKKSIVTRVGIAADSISVVYLAPNKLFQRVTDTRKLKETKQKYSIPSEFLLYVGDVNWNKNIQGLLEAVALVKRPIVLVGKAFMNTDLVETQEIRHLIDQLKIAQYVFLPGFVPDEDLADLYTLASVYIQPSFAEGFGFPVLEAMQCGAVTVVSKASSLAEIAGPSVLVDPYNPADIASGIHKALGLNGKKSYQEEAHTWVARFSWKTVARDTVAVYEKILGA